MAAKVFEKSAEETAFRAVLKEVYESGKNSVAVLWADAALSASFQETLYAFLLKDVLGSAAAGVKLRALCAFCGGEAETAQTEYTHETFIGLMSPITKGENKGAVRLDLFFKKGEAHFIPTLFAYVMNNILGDRFKKAVPDSLDHELEGEDGSMALGASLAGEENTEREVLGEMMSADMVQAVYETLHDRPDELFAFAAQAERGPDGLQNAFKDAAPPAHARKGLSGCDGAAGRCGAEQGRVGRKGPLTLGTYFKNGRLPRRRGAFRLRKPRENKIEEVRSTACNAVRYGVHKINARLGRVHRSKSGRGQGYRCACRCTFPSRSCRTSGRIYSRIF